MTWVKIDDRFPDHHKVDELSDKAFRLHVRAICHCSRDLTDGALKAKAVKVLCTKSELTTARARKVIQELIDAELWLPAGDGYLVNDYLEYNPSAAEVKARQEEIKSKRSEAGRRGAEARWGDGKRGKPPSKRGDTVVMAPSPVHEDLKPLALELTSVMDRAQKAALREAGAA